MALGRPYTFLPPPILATSWRAAVHQTRRRTHMCSRPESVVRQEVMLLAALVGKEQGRGMSEEDRSRVMMLVNVLEGNDSAVAVKWPETLDKLDGTWNLLYSSEPLPPLFFPPFPLRNVGIEQRYEIEKRLVQNVIQFALDFPGLRWRSAPDLEVIVGNSFAVIAADTIKFSLETVEARVRGVAGERMRSLLPPLQVSRLMDAAKARARRQTSPEVQTTYYGEHILVTRASEGELRIFVRPVF